MNYNANLARYLASSGMIDEVYVVDVGCSGGIDRALRQLEPVLAGVGIDPLVNEVKRLNAAESNPRLAYVAAYVVSDRDYPKKEYQASNWFYRSSAAAVLEPDLDMLGTLIGESRS